jgi:flagellar hook assembly protein FlgD
MLLKAIPEEFTLHQNYPNPFNPVTTINYDLPQQTHVNLMIYDILGREVVKLVSEETPAGYQSVIWNTRNSLGTPVSAGIYFYQIQTRDFVKTRKMVLLK